MDWFMDIVGRLPDGAVLLSGAATTAVIALAVAVVTRGLFFARGAAMLETHSKLAELVHNSLLAFTVFILAMALNDVRANLGNADDATLREAGTIARLDRELEIANGVEAETARKRLRDYADAVTSSEWQALSAPEPALSPRAEQSLIVFIAGVRAVTAAQPDLATTFGTLVDKLEDLRQGRLESATKSVPRVFWWMIGAFLFGAMVMNGRHPLDRASASLITLHMGAIGLVMALILVMDEPFRGETSISSTPISKALGMIGSQ